jgi:serine/threonine protein kinase
MTTQDVDPSAATAFGLGPGTVLLGQYELERRLGAGGMGEVWLARDQHLERSVAVKVLPAILATSARAAEALRSEAAQAIELSHRSIARVYHYGQHDDLPVLVMEYVEGESLAQHLDTHRSLEPARVAELLGPIADALDYAHQKKVVHRDLKPANIMLRGDGSPVLMDFGLAAEARDQSSIQGKTARSPGPSST